MMSRQDEADFEEFEAEIDRVNNIIHNLMMDNHLSIQTEIKEPNIVPEKPKKTTPAEHQLPESSFPKKTCINPGKSAETLSNLTSPTMPQSGFMQMVEEDAHRRARDREQRNGKAKELMIKGNTAFKEGNLEKALCFYNEAIETRRDSSLLYTNRAVIHLSLGLLTKAIDDCDHAIKLYDNIKPRLIKAKALRQSGREFEAWVAETKLQFPKYDSFIDEYLKESAEGAAR